MEYDLYHDESKSDGYWHGMLLVPRIHRDYLLGLLDSVRAAYAYREPLSFKHLRGMTGPKSECARSWISVGMGALMQRKKRHPYQGFALGRVRSAAGGRARTRYQLFDRIVAAKFILFRDIDDHRYLSDSFFPDRTSKIETTLRIGLKGGLHLLGSEQNPVFVSSLHFDGHEHYGRNLDRERIVGRIEGLRSYCSFSESLSVDDRSSDHKRSHSQEYGDCQLLQLTDLMIGGFRALIIPHSGVHKRQIAKPLDHLVESWSQGYIRMKRSRWFEGYCLSACTLASGRWQFMEILKERSVTLQQDIFSRS